MDKERELATPNLSPTERKVMKLILQGRPLTYIANELSISPKTVSTYKSRIMAKLNIDNNTELVIQGMLLFGVGGIYMDGKK
jgi:two-component system, NarL family, invasion response regulator UvrY